MLCYASLFCNVIPLWKEMVDSDVSINLRVIIKPDSTSIGSYELRKNIKTLQLLKNYGNGQFYSDSKLPKFNFLFFFKHVRNTIFS